MTTEFMTIRQALAEKHLLDNKIKKLFSSIRPVATYFKSEPYVEGLSPAEYEEQIKSKFQSLNAMIRRREAINLAILKQNTIATIEVPVFVSFDKFEDSSNGIVVEKEYISLAAAINRKNYYKIILENLKSLQMKASREFKEFENRCTKARDFSNQTVNERYKDRSNAPKDMAALVQEEYERNKPVIIDPMSATVSIDKWIDNIETYLANIDTKLSSATESNSVEVVY